MQPMCGRINLSDNEGVQALMAMLGVPLLSEPSKSDSTLLHQPNFTPRWNISPTAILSTVVANSTTENSAISGTTMRWGLEAPWSEPDKAARRLINARSETLLSKPTFRDLAKHYRTVVPVNGFYEWKVEADERIPYYVQVHDLPAMLLAGVYQPLTADDIAKEKRTAVAKAKANASPQMGFLFDDATEEETDNPDDQGALFTGDFAVVTTEATNAMAAVHHRAPVMLNVEQAKRWLYTHDPAEIESLTAPESIMDVSVRRVSRAVNSSRNDGPECTSPPKAE